MAIQDQGNRILELYPYECHPGTWVFDDPDTNLRQEPFVRGISEMITAIVQAKGIRNATGGITLQFSGEPFPGCDTVLNWVRAGTPTEWDAGQEKPWNRHGNWYRGVINGTVTEGWLCPALGRYFQECPMKIAVKILPLRDGVNPIWNPADGEGGERIVRLPE